MNYFLAFLPILAVLGLMIALKWGGQQAGPLGWLVAVVIAFLAFGLTPEAFWVSQLKGLYLSFTVLLILWPAMFLYYIIDGMGGIMAVAAKLKMLVPDHGLLIVMLAWAFSGMLEGLAGYGLPIAVVSPMLVGLGVPAIVAVVASAVGHTWAVTFGNMGIVYQTLLFVTNMDGAALAPVAALLLGFACLACGLVVARILKEGRLWPVVTLMAIVMAGVQYAMAVSGLTPMAGFGAGLIGVVLPVLLSKLASFRRVSLSLPLQGSVSIPYQGSIQPSTLPVSTAQVEMTTPPHALTGALASYGALAVVMSLIALVAPIHDWFSLAAIHMTFPQVKTTAGFMTASSSQVFRPMLHPGFAVIIIVVLSYLIYARIGWCQKSAWQPAARATWHSASASSLGVIAMIGLAMIMDHSGMTLLLARGAAQLLGQIFPLASPLVGILGAFATGSNNNSNVLFAGLQQNAAILLAIDPRILVAAQTAGGALGSMLAPAKIIVGCSTVGLKGQDGLVLRKTVPYGLVMGLIIGVIALIISRL